MATKSEPQANRIVAFIPIDGFVEGQGFRVSLVVEGEDGHHPTGNWPYHGRVDETLPWFWGNDYDTAVKLAEEYNAEHGISKEEANKIVLASIEKSLRGSRR